MEFFCAMRNIPRLDRTQGQAVLIRAFPLGGSWFEAQCSGQLIVARTREPLLDGARALLAAGYHPDTVIVLRHAGSDINALRARIGTAARFYVEESGHGPLLRSLRKAAPRAVDRPPVAQTCRAATHHPVGGRDGDIDEPNAAAAKGELRGLS